MKVLGRHIREPGNIDGTVSPSGRRLAPKVYLYDQIIDLMLANPGITLTAIGKALGRSPAWLSFTVHSDAFKDLYLQRRSEKNVKVNEELTTQLQRVAMKGLRIIEEKIDKNPLSISTPLALELADKSLERLGYGMKVPMQAAVQINNNSITVSAEDFAHAQRIVRQVESEVIPSGRSPESESVAPGEARSPPLTLEVTANPSSVPTVPEWGGGVEPSIDELIEAMHDEPPSERSEREE